jgi:hypothetical protein
MATPFKFDTNAHGNINDSGIKDLPLGKHNYVITKITYAPIKSDPTKKRHHLIIELRHEQGGKFTQFLEIHPKDKSDNEVTRARIAADEFNSYVLATGVKKGTVLTPEKFKILYEKTIGIETRKTVVKATNKEYINVTQIVKDGFPDEELTPMGAASGKAASAPEEEDEDAAPVAPAKTAKKKKAKPAPPVVEEEEEEEEEEDPDEEEEESEEEEEEEEEDPFA